MQSTIQQLEKEIQAKKPKGILVSIDLYNALKERGLVKDEQLVFPGTQIPVFSYPMLKGKVFVTKAFLSNGEDFRLPPL